jgi:hypothetical protein
MYKRKWRKKVRINRRRDMIEEKEGRIRKIMNRQKRRWKKKSTRRRNTSRRRTKKKRKMTNKKTTCEI